MSGWVKSLHSYAIKPIQQFAYVKGKNTTDISMIIDAMDILYSDSVDAFALMTSDSDFTPLAMRILENDFPVYGFGEDKTPQPFVDACSSFFHIKKTANSKNMSAGGEKALTKAQLRKDDKLMRLLRTSVEESSEDDEWASMNKVGSYLSKKHPSFSSSHYGYKQLGKLIQVTELFDVEMRNKQKYIRCKKIQAINF